MQRWLKRAGLILFFGLWAAAGLQIWAKKQESREMEAVAAFSNIGDWKPLDKLELKE